jgi:hypothetical protein
LVKRACSKKSRERQADAAAIFPGLLNIL